jgi:hypothetical protein
MNSSAVCIAIGYGLDDGQVEVPSPGRIKNFHLHIAQAG